MNTGYSYKLMFLSIIYVELVKITVNRGALDFGWTSGLQSSGVSPTKAGKFGGDDEPYAMVSNMRSIFVFIDLSTRSLSLVDDCSLFFP